MEELTVPRIEIDYENCDKEGLCVRVCPWVFERKGKDSFPIVAYPLSCDFCGHCVAVCPTGAITHYELDMDNFPEVDKGSIIQSDDLQQFLRTRRSLRNYNQKRQVKRSMVEKMLETARYSPTGSNYQSLEHIVLLGKEAVSELVRITIEEFRNELRVLEDVDYRNRMSEIEIRDSEYWVDTFKRLISDYEDGKDMLFYDPPAVIITHAPGKRSDNPTACPVEDATLASFHMMLMAETLGLGTCYIGNFYEAVKDNQVIMEFLGVPEENDILMAFSLGYPTVKYRRLVDRNPVKVKWIGG